MINILRLIRMRGYVHTTGFLLLLACTACSTSGSESSATERDKVIDVSGDTLIQDDLLGTRDRASVPKSGDHSGASPEGDAAVCTGAATAAGSTDIRCTLEFDYIDKNKDGNITEVELRSYSRAHREFLSTRSRLRSSSTSTTTTTPSRSAAKSTTSRFKRRARWWAR